MEKLVSIIVPVYNVESYLDRCINSIINQTYKNLEIILIDDGSKDNSGVLCDSWGERDCRIISFHQENRGLSNARNKGIEKSKGDYLTFVDSDDVIASNMIEKLINLLEKDQADISICGVYHIFDENNINFEKAGKTDSQIQSFDRETAIKELWYQKSFLPSACGKVYKRQLFENIRFAEGIYFEDIDIMHELFWNSQKIVYQDIPLYGYIHRSDSITTASFSERDCQILQISKKILNFAYDTDENLLPSAKSYAVTAAFRIYLNAPREDTHFSENISEAIKTLEQFGKSVLKDSNARGKTRCALLLYFYCKPFLRIVYKKVDRWT